MSKVTRADWRAQVRRVDAEAKRRTKLRCEVERVFGQGSRVVIGPPKPEPTYGTALVCEESDRQPAHLFLGTVLVRHTDADKPSVVGKHCTRAEVFELREQLSNWLARQSEPRLRIGTP